MKAPDPILQTRDAELQGWVDMVNYILNAGKYEFFLSSDVPTYKANNGEQLVYSNDTGTLRRLYVYINGVWCSVNFNSSGTVSSTTGIPDRILDSDQDTGIFTQFLDGENRLRFYSMGYYVAGVDTYGWQLGENYPVVFDGLGGGTMMMYDSASQYLQVYLKGELRMEL